MNNDFLEALLDAFAYPEPSIYDNEDEWLYFAGRATYSRVEKLFVRISLMDFKISIREKMLILLNRLAKGNWPEFSNEFIEDNKSTIFVVASKKTAKKEVYENFDLPFPAYLIDKNNQMLGIVVNKHTIICGIVNERFNTTIANCFLGKKMLPSASDMKSIGLKIGDINHMLCKINGPKISTTYWFKNSGWMHVWDFCQKTQHAQEDENLMNGFIFLM